MEKPTTSRNGPLEIRIVCEDLESGESQFDIRVQAPEASDALRKALRMAGVLYSEIVGTPDPVVGPVRPMVTPDRGERVSPSAANRVATRTFPDPDPGEAGSSASVGLGAPDPSPRVPPANAGVVRTALAPPVLGETRQANCVILMTHGPHSWREGDEMVDCPGADAVPQGGMPPPPSAQRSEQVDAGNA